MRIPKHLFRKTIRVVLPAGLACMGPPGGGTALALDPRKPITRYVRDVWTTDEGLPQISVLTTVRTRDGYLWLGTQQGLARFDGVRFAVFDTSNTPAIRNNYVLKLLEDRAGNLWIGTYGGGLTRFRDGVFENPTMGLGLPNGNVPALYEDRAGNLWIGTGGSSGLCRLRNGRLKVFTEKDGLPKSTVISLCEDRNGSLWIGTAGGGLARLKDGQFSAYTVKDGLPGDFIRSLCTDREGNLWIGSRGGGLARWSDGARTIFTTKDGLPSNSVWALCEDRDGNLWIGTEGGGLARWRHGQFSTYGKSEGLPSEYVLSLCEDREGSLWVGTGSGGLVRLKNALFTTYTTKDGLSSDSIVSVLQDRDGALWAGTIKGGLNRLRAGRWRAYSIGDGLSSDTVVSLCEARDGGLWVGTYGGGLNRWRDDGEKVAYTTKDGLSNDIVRVLYEDDGALWIGTDGGGLNRLEKGRLTAYTTKEGLSNNFVFCVHRDRRGDLWIGTDRGLNRFRDGTFAVFTSKDGLPNDQILALYEDRHGALWIGTGGGLSRLEKGRFTSYRRRDGFFDDAVFAILEDDSENFWMSSGKGVWRVSKRTLDELATGEVSSPTSIAYGTTDGMGSRDCVGRFQPAGWKDREGKLWFPTLKGLVVVDPREVAKSHTAPPVRIEAFIVDRRLVSTGGKAILSPESSNLEFHYTALSLLAPEKIRFKYKLDGVDRDWVDAEGRRVAFYGSVSPGNRTFRVIACNGDGTWNREGAAVRFRIRPYYYQTGWFYLVCALAVLGAGWGVQRLRVRSIEVEATVLSERNRIAQEIHDSLAQGLSGIIVQLEAARRIFGDAPGEVLGPVEKAAALARQSLEEARRSVWALRPAFLEEADFGKALAALADNVSASRGFTVDLGVHGSLRTLPERTQVALLRIAQEAIANAVRHADARHVRIDLRYDGASVALSIRDDGKGFAPGPDGLPATRGFGLAGMRRRAQAIGGRFHLRSAPGEGTEVLVTVPMRRSRIGLVRDGILRRLRGWRDPR